MYPGYRNIIFNPSFQRRICNLLSVSISDISAEWPRAQAPFLNSIKHKFSLCHWFPGLYVYSGTKLGAEPCIRNPMI